MERHRRRRVLLLGFEPFGGLSRNSSGEIAEHFAASPPPATEITAAVLPVSFADLPARIATLATTSEADVVLGLGLFVGSAYVRVETTALNVADFDVADNQGAYIRNARPEPGGPAARFASYDAARLAEALRRGGIPARVSHHAGTHLCNLTLYHLLKHAGGPGRAVGFLHLPLLPEQAAELIAAGDRDDRSIARPPVEHASMAIGTQRAAVALAIAALAGRPAEPESDDLDWRDAGSASATVRGAA